MENEHARNALIQQWLDAKKVSIEAVELEREVRQAVVTMLFPTPKKGTNRYPLNNGYALKFACTERYEIGDKEMVDPATGLAVSLEDQAYGLLDQIAALGQEAEAYGKRLIRFKPELSASEYKKLDTDFETQKAVKALIDEVLTIKPNSPQLELEEPKKKG